MSDSLISLQSNEPVDDQPEQNGLSFQTWLTMTSSLAHRISLPILRTFFNPTAQLVAIRSVVAIAVIIWIIMTSLTSYVTFYRHFMPKQMHIEPVYLQYMHTSLSKCINPEGWVDLRRGTEYGPLRHGQAYDIHVSLNLPTSDINFDIGNFMVKVELLTTNGSTVAHGSRPAILAYQSKTHRILRVLTGAVPLLMGLTQESQNLYIPLMEEYVENYKTPITHIRVLLSTCRLQVYNATVQLRTNFHGLRYYMYHYRIPTATVFVVAFAIIELICAAFAWRLIVRIFWSNQEEKVQEQTPQEYTYEYSSDASGIDPHD
ncbi:putative adipose-regulatory protein-domain-containing protein [Phycomyces blakesleeanus]|uniref:Adipose-regulatory protein-domain-containing protein n=1 Tax=Phycomyces blakesleeanus TaxID=4837 RepID=A0ABR3BIP0_PHYBL